MFKVAGDYEMWERLSEGRTCRMRCFLTRFARTTTLAADGLIYTDFYRISFDPANRLMRFCFRIP